MMGKDKLKSYSEQFYRVFEHRGETFFFFGGGVLLLQAPFGELGLI